MKTILSSLLALACILSVSPSVAFNSQDPKPGMRLPHLPQLAQYKPKKYRRTPYLCKNYSFPSWVKPWQTCSYAHSLNEKNELARKRERQDECYRLARKEGVSLRNCILHVEIDYGKRFRDNNKKNRRCLQRCPKPPRPKSPSYSHCTQRLAMKCYSTTINFSNCEARSGGAYGKEMSCRKYACRDFRACIKKPGCGPRIGELFKWLKDQSDKWGRPRYFTNTSEWARTWCE